MKIFTRACFKKLDFIVVRIKGMYQTVYGESIRVINLCVRLFKEIIHVTVWYMTTRALILKL